MLNCPLTSDPDLVHCCRLYLVAVVVVVDKDVDEYNHSHSSIGLVVMVKLYTRVVPCCM